MGKMKTYSEHGCRSGAMLWEVSRRLLSNRLRRLPRPRHHRRRRGMISTALTPVPGQSTKVWNGSERRVGRIKSRSQVDTPGVLYCCCQVIVFVSVVPSVNHHVHRIQKIDYRLLTCCQLLVSIPSRRPTPSLLRIRHVIPVALGNNSAFKVHSSSVANSNSNITTKVATVL